MNLEFATKEDIDRIIKQSDDGRNTKFLSASNNLWTRFKNYQTAPPLALVDGDIVCLIFATFNKGGYTNLYEIVTVQGREGRGYASTLWDYYVDYACNTRHSSRLKISCTPSSVSWHMKNGLVFWAVDPTGSLRSDQPIFKNREEQFIFQNMAMVDPSMALPSEKVCEQLREESIDAHGFGMKKIKQVEDAIQTVGKAWIRRGLFDMNTLEDFYGQA